MIQESKTSHVSVKNSAPKTNKTQIFTSSSNFFQTLTSGDSDEEEVDDLGDADAIIIPPDEEVAKEMAEVHFHIKTSSSSYSLKIKLYIEHFN